MIRRHTAFIMGAGTSVPYGFPSGEGLMRIAQSLSLEGLKQKLYAPDLREVALHDALQSSYDPSLDALLELREDITPVGKRLMASLLLEIEFNSRERPLPDDHWLSLFFQELTAGTRSLEDFAGNQITVITYNYDRLLEFRLSRALRAHYGRAEEECIAVLKKIPIIHLHGDLGPLPGFAAQGTVPFGPQPDDEQRHFNRCIDRAAERIVVVHEAKDETEDFERARHAVSHAELVVLLGFGYGTTNIDRLRLAQWRHGVGILGSAFRLSVSRIAFARRPFQEAGHQINFGEPSEATRTFLDNRLRIFRD